MTVTGRCVGWVVVDGIGVAEGPCSYRQARRTCAEMLRAYPTHPVKVAAVVIPAKRKGKAS